MKPSTPVTVTVTGAGGQIGYALLFRIASGAMLGPDVPVRLQLLEIPAGQKAAEGTALELQDCAFPTLDSVNVTTDAATGFDGTNIALLVGARPRGPGMERADLLQANGAIFGPQGTAINNHAAEDIKVLVVGNPANTNALIASGHAPDVPTSRFTAMTRLDHNRALAQLAASLDTPVNTISNVIIWGNHSASQVPDISHALLQKSDGSKIPLTQALAQKLGGAHALEPWLEEVFIPRVAKRGAEIIQVRGFSSAASAAAAAVDHMHDWVFGTAEGWTSAAISSDGSYGIDQGLMCSFPVRSNSESWQIEPGLEFSPSVGRHIEASLQELREERDMVRSLGLVT